MRALGWDASGWDPVYRADGPKRQVQIVNLGFILNVIEDPAERVETLHAAWSYAEELLVVSTMIRGQESYSVVREFGDGVIHPLAFLDIVEGKDNPPVNILKRGKS